MHAALAASLGEHGDSGSDTESDSDVVGTVSSESSVGHLPTKGGDMRDFWASMGH